MDAGESIEFITEESCRSRINDERYGGTFALVERKVLIESRRPGGERREPIEDTLCCVPESIRVRRGFPEFRRYSFGKYDAVLVEKGLRGAIDVSCDSSEAEKSERVRDDERNLRVRQFLRGLVEELLARILSRTRKFAAASGLSSPFNCPNVISFS